MNTVFNESNDSNAIREVVNLYFKGTFEGNAELLREGFHPEAHITGILEGQYYDWPLEDFIVRVTQGPTSAKKGEAYDKQIIHMDIQDNAASVKARVVVSSYAFTDYITLLKINGKWNIRNKSFSGSAV